LSPVAAGNQVLALRPWSHFVNCRPPKVRICYVTRFIWGDYGIAQSSLRGFAANWRVSLANRARSPAPQFTRSDAAALHAQAQKADCAFARAQRGVSPIPVAADWQGDKSDQSEAPGWVNYFAAGHSQWVLQLHQRLGGEEGQAPSGAGSETEGLLLEAVE